MRSTATERRKSSIVAEREIMRFAVPDPDTGIRPHALWHKHIHNVELDPMHISADTLAWWMRQSDAARAVFDRANPVQHHFPARVALGALEAWVRSVVLEENAQHKDLRVWSNGADFDLPMLAHACRTFNVALPWPAYAGRCYRTYKNLPGARAVVMQRGGVHHNALDDAIDQARHLCAIHAALFGATGGAA